MAQNLLTLWLKRQQCLACRTLLPWEGTGWSIQLKVDISMNLQFKKVKKKSLQQNKEHLPLVPCCTNHRNKCLYSTLSSPSDCIQTHSLQHTDKPATTWKLNSTVSLDLKQRLRKYDMYNQLQILYYRVSTYSRSYLKGIDLENEIRVKNKQNKTTFLQLCFIKRGGFSLNLRNG